MVIVDQATSYIDKISTDSLILVSYQDFEYTQEGELYLIKRLPLKTYFYKEED